MASLVPRLSAEWRSYPLARLLTCLLVVFLVLFPKGGIKFGVPLTWGYMLLALLIPPMLLIRLFVLQLRFRKATLLAAASLFPFDLLFVYSFLHNGVGQLGETISDVTSFFALPVAFLLIFPAFLKSVDGELLDRLLRFCMLSAALFGIILFVLYPITGKLIEVPYLTVNADDYGLIETTKHINRGAFLKLISTYNNGNLYGAATLILLPLYDRLEKKLWRRNVLKLALILTLSRTVWFGLIAEQMLSFAYIGVKSVRTFPRVPAGTTLRRGGVLVVTAVCIVAGLLLTNGSFGFLFDSSLGGRSATLAAQVHGITWLPSEPVGAFFEVVYASALAGYGVLGLLSFILIFVGPILLFAANPAIAGNPLRLAALKGLILYILVSCVDGAINLIPVMAFYWFAYMIFLEGWPARHPANSSNAVDEQTDHLPDIPFLPQSLS
jgi:hypothetical protein